MAPMMLRVAPEAIRRRKTELTPAELGPRAEPGAPHVRHDTA